MGDFWLNIDKNHLGRGLKSDIFKIEAIRGHFNNYDIGLVRMREIKEEEDDVLTFRYSRLMDKFAVRN